MTIQEIENTLIQGISSITNQDASAISPDVPFHDLGIDSMGFIEILVFIEKTFKLPLIASDLTRKDFETIHALASFIKGKVQHGTGHVGI
jgi:acyl carrier protein